MEGGRGGGMQEGEVSNLSGGRRSRCEEENRSGWRGAFVKRQNVVFIFSVLVVVSMSLVLSQYIYFFKFQVPRNLFLGNLKHIINSNNVSCFLCYRNSCMNTIHHVENIWFHVPKHVLPNCDFVRYPFLLVHYPMSYLAQTASCQHQLSSMTRMR